MFYIYFLSLLIEKMNLLNIIWPENHDQTNVVITVMNYLEGFSQNS